jgi:hypothetical protein
MSSGGAIVMCTIYDVQNVTFNPVISFSKEDHRGILVPLSVEKCVFYHRFVATVLPSDLHSH